MTADDIIERLALQAHPEGGWYRQTYHSATTTTTDRGSRAASTAIYFLLRGEEISALHRIASDEVWHFYLGSPLRVESLAADGTVEAFVLGNDLAAGERLQAWVPAGRWFGSGLVHGGWALVGCTVAPGFDFADFEMGDRHTLLGLFPQCREMIHRLTRE